MQDFRKLHVWRRAHRVALAVYADTQLWVKQGHAALASQARRAAMSVSANITEGCGARSNREFARYLQIAIASTSELDYHLLFAADAHVVGRARQEAMARELVEIRKMLVVLRKRILSAADA